MSNTKVAVISGYFDPIHQGHIEYARLAKEYVGDAGKVICIVNNEYQAGLKKGYSFVPQEDRVAIMSAIKYIDEVILSIDTDRTVCKTLELLCNRDTLKPTHFLNGGDVTADKKCPEEPVCQVHSVELVYGFGDKIQSSSWIIAKSIETAYTAREKDNNKSQ